MKEKLDKIKAVICEGCHKNNQPAMMREEKEIRQMLVAIQVCGKDVSLKSFTNWIFYREDIVI
jgi:hypothetical protein